MRQCSFYSFLTPMEVFVCFLNTSGYFTLLFPLDLLSCQNYLKTSCLFDVLLHVMKMVNIGHTHQNSLPAPWDQFTAQRSSSVSVCLFFSFSFIMWVSGFMSVLGIQVAFFPAYRTFTLIK